ncbi:albusnodin family lasso peptide [Streptomyces sp. SID8385]|nr:albusnodin family lasso peptide [Streptomyces sp. SID8385]QHC16410.1 albusnodin family lasso peptide [Streptomyces sp. GF20]QXQ25560.1 albusnodin family lasso peptide [Streptomyces albidoflavus]QXQ31487.1 albusnodin family lasso peptide [Streptomyces albidoflavus]
MNIPPESDERSTDREGTGVPREYRQLLFRGRWLACTGDVGTPPGRTAEREEGPVSHPTSTPLTGITTTGEAAMIIDLGDAADLTLGGDSDSSENKQSPYSH